MVNMRYNKKMDIFNYENIWYSVTFWGFMGIGGATVLLALFIMGNPEGKKWVAVWVLSVLAFAPLVGWGMLHSDKTHAEASYNQSVFDHIKNTAGFDKLEGEYNPNAEQANMFKGFYGEDEVTCLAGAEPGSDKIEFGCGVDFTPLDKVKEEYQKQKKTETAKSK